MVLFILIVVEYINVIVIVVSCAVLPFFAESLVADVHSVFGLLSLVVDAVAVLRWVCVVMLARGVVWSVRS